MNINTLIDWLRRQPSSAEQRKLEDILLALESSPHALNAVRMCGVDISAGTKAANEPELNFQ